MGRPHPNQPYDQHHAVDAKAPAVSMSQVIAAGLASAGAAAATSRFGVAGTLVGAALTTMIITGGSAVLKAYLETLGGKLQNVPDKLRAGRNRKQAGRTAEQPAPDAPTQAVQRNEDRKPGFFGRIKSAFEWFRGLPASQKRSILLKAAIPMAIAFVIAVVAVTGTELLGGRTLSCMVWGECYVAADGSGPSTSFGSLAGGGGGEPVQPGEPGGGGLFDGSGPAEEQYQ